MITDENEKTEQNVPERCPKCGGGALYRLAHEGPWRCYFCDPSLIIRVSNFLSKVRRQVSCPGIPWKGGGKAAVQLFQHGSADHGGGGDFRQVSQKAVLAFKKAHGVFR